MHRDFDHGVEFLEVAERAVGSGGLADVSFRGIIVGREVTHLDESVVGDCHCRWPGQNQVLGRLESYL